MFRIEGVVTQAEWLFRSAAIHDCWCVYEVRKYYAMVVFYSYMGAYI